MARRCAPASIASTAPWWRKWLTRRCWSARMIGKTRRVRRDLEGRTEMKHTAFTGRLLILGFGSIGQGVLPLILRHIDMPKDRIEILTSDARGEAIAAQHG
ncbi:MAG: saccharopine dehydrogenase NADP-binding domain-containing protein, partial [Alphaproteobacteria bacterium]